MHEIRSLMEGGGRREILAAKKAERRAADEGPGLNRIAIRREECRRGNQRREDRHLNLVERAILYFRRRRYEVDVVNVSSHGVMLRSDLLPNLGERLEIQFDQCNRTRCHVRWIKGGRIGLELADETVIIAPADVRELVVGGRRAGEQPPRLEVRRERERRQSLLRTATLYFQQESQQVRVHNISSQGAMIRCAVDLLPGTAVVIELGGAAANAVQGRVCWRQSDHMGIRFDQPFDLTILADAMAQLEPEASPPIYLKPDYLKSDGDPDSPWSARQDALRRDEL